MRIVVGKPIEQAVIKSYADNPKAMMDFLREETYRLSPTPFESLEYGLELEEKHKQ